jgi:thioredoxin reductase (NADPH)
MYDVIVIGAGPAGLTSAIYLCRANKKVLVLEALTYGGQIINTSRIDNYPALPHVSGFDFATNLYNQAIELGAEVKFSKVTDIKLGDTKEVITSDNTYKCKAIILAMGAEKRKLGLEHEDEFIGKGISYCATCDGMFFKNKVVAIVGGGDTALGDAEYLADIVSKLYIIHRRDIFRGNERQVEVLKKKDNIEFIMNSNVTRLNGDKKLESIEVTNNNGTKQDIEIDGLFIAVGQVPEVNNITSKFDVDERGYIKASEDTLTNVDGIFVAGDIRTKELRQLTTAVSDGANAATKAIEYINR